jgi:urea transporter
MSPLFKAFLIIVIGCAVIVTVTWAFGQFFKPNGVQQPVLAYLMMAFWFVVCMTAALGNISGQFSLEPENHDIELEEQEEGIDS